MAEVAEYKEKSHGIQTLAYSYIVTDEDSYARGEDILRDIKVAETAMSGRKEEITRPLMQGLASLRDLFRPLESSLTDAKKTVKEKMLAYRVEQDERERIERERIAKRVEKGTMRADTAAGKLAEIKTSSAGTRTVKKLFISDEAAIPYQYLVPDREKITKALFAGEIVPGAELKEEKIIVTPR